MIVKLTSLKPSRTIVAVCSSFFTLALLEYLVSGSFFAYTGMDPEQAMSNENLWAILGIIQAVLLNIVALVVPRFLKPDAGVWKQ
jgi:hypothetical protein